MKGVLPAARARLSGGLDMNVRLAVVAVLGAAIFGLVGLRLWSLTIVNGERYAELAEANQVRQLPLQAPRGAIIDRNGKPIVTNRAARQLVLHINDVPQGEREALYRRVAKALGRSQGDIRAKVRQAIDPLQPIVLEEDLTDDAALLYLEEHAYELPGIQVRQGYRRDYVHSSAAAHIVGQVTEVSEEQLETEFTNLKPGDQVGQSGVERTYDEYLRGADGYQAVEVDASGIPRGLGRGVPAKPGNNLRLTVDLSLQQATENALRQGVAFARRAGDGGHNADAAAAVAIEPATGEVLALASYPTYDPNVFVTEGNDPTIERLLNDERTPLSNRAIAGLYPPGSIYKPVTAIAAMSEGHLKPRGLVPCPSYMQVYDVRFNNWFRQDQGLMDVREALSQSCDTFFYKLALDFYRSPGNPLQKWSAVFGLGTESGIDLPGEEAGLVPTKEWRRETFEGWSSEWTPGHSVNLSIGQGDLLTTPLQMTRIYAGIANDGVMHVPRVAERVEDPGGRAVLAIKPEEPARIDVPERFWRPIRDGIYRAANSGSGTSTAVFDGFPVEVSGKTGTAEKPPYGDMAWYCAYAPSPAPTIAACAIVERGGHGGTAAAPIVLRMFQQYFGETGGNLAVKDANE